MHSPSHTVSPSQRRGRRAFVQLAAAGLFALAASACGNGSVNSEDAARRAYVGFDLGVSRALDLGLEGYGMASSANIPPVTGMGAVAGTMVVGGQVSRGAGDNREMRLTVALDAYEDMVREQTDAGDAGAALRVVYGTSASPAAPLALELSLRDIPNGTMTGTLTGTAQLSGDLMGTATFNLTLAGRIEAGPTMGSLRRVPGSLRVTGTVMAGTTTFNVDVTR